MRVPDRMTGMAQGKRIWLVYNRSSGSNDDAALAELEAALGDAGFVIAQRSCFPDEAAPDAAELERQSIDLACIFAGDGTIHTAVIHLFGWGGKILVLPGGTMNLLSHRLHGEATPAEIVARAGAGKGRKVRPTILQSEHGPALTGALIGPGSEWNNAREAMRNRAVGELVSAVAGAASQSVAGDRAVCRGCERVRPEGYPAISITPEDDGIAVKGYYADGLGDYLGQLAAILSGDFRDGPHDSLGTFAQVELASIRGEPLGLLMDGEQFDGTSSVTFRIAKCGVDLIATADVD